MKYKILKNIECLLFCLYLGFFKSTYSSPDDIPSILDEFNIYHPIIINTMTDTKDLMRIVKSMSFNGQSINFNENKINRLYQSYLIFTNLKNFKWHEPTSAPILVVSTIKNEIDLKHTNVSIGSQVLFLDWFSLKVYESYNVKKVHVTRYLGQFQEKEECKPGMMFVPSKNYSLSMEKRRKNFYGLQIKVAISKFSLGISGPADLSDSVKFFPNNNTYDVTNMVTNSENKHEFLMVLKWMEAKFNFTAIVFLRKDMKFGAPYISSNGSTIMKEGVFQYLIEDSLEFVWESFVMLNIRSQFVDFLYTITTEHDAIFVPIEDTYEEIDWSVFVKPLATGVWIAIIIKCVIFSTLASIIDWFNDFKLVSRL